MVNAEVVSDRKDRSDTILNFLLEVASGSVNPMRIRSQSADAISSATRFAASAGLSASRMGRPMTI